MSIGGRANLKHRKIPLSSLSTKDETSKGLEKEKLEEINSTLSRNPREVQAM